jgi:hypothetical protein
LATKREKGGEVRFTVSATLYRYLGRLAEKSVLGKTENDVARQILTNTLAVMRQEDYRDTDTKPTLVTRSD